MEAHKMNSSLINLSSCSTLEENSTHGKLSNPLLRKFNFVIKLQSQILVQSFISKVTL